MGAPLRIAFPVIECGPYCLHFRGPAILLHCEPIAPAHPLRDPVPHCRVVGQLQDGKQVQFTIPLHVWRDALKRPTLFYAAPGDSIGARAGVLIGPDGQPLKRVDVPSVAHDSAVGG
jgi:hypothetical protein